MRLALGLDQLTLLGNDSDRLDQLQSQIREHLGFAKEINSVGQVYPRSLDFEAISCLYQLGSGIANLSRTLRLMAGGEMVTEGFAKGQVGSSAMPHKMNTRSTERVNGFQVIIGGYLHMIGGLNGDQWFEGDVSCSVACRVALPDSFFAFDGMIETMLHVLDDMGIYDAIIDRDVERYLPFLSTTTLLMEAVQKEPEESRPTKPLKSMRSQRPFRCAKVNPRMICQSDSQMMLVFLLIQPRLKPSRSQSFSYWSESASASRSIYTDGREIGGTVP